MPDLQILRDTYALNTWSSSRMDELNLSLAAASNIVLF